MVVHGDRFSRAHPPREVQRLLPTRDGDHASAGIARELDQDRPKKADADNCDSLSLPDVAAAEDVERTAERLQRQIKIAKRVR